MIDTVRVAHPLDNSQFMTINADQYDPDTHGEPWHTQAPGFRGLPEPKVEAPIDPAVRDLSAVMIRKFFDAEDRETTRPLFSTLSPEAQLARLREKDAEFDRYVKDRAQDKANREQADKDAAWAEQAAKTKAAVAAKDAEHAAQQVASKAKEASESLSQDNPNPAPAQANAAPAPASTAAPWATGNEASANNEPLSVSKGPGSKWFVMRGTTPVTEGFGTKAEAEAKRTEMDAA